MALNENKMIFVAGGLAVFFAGASMLHYAFAPDCGAPDSEKMQNALADLAVDFEETGLSSFNQFGKGTAADFWNNKDPAAETQKAAVVTDMNTGKVCIFFADPRR